MIKHIEVDKRMSQVVIHGNTVYLAGQVAFDKPVQVLPSKPGIFLSELTGTFSGPAPENRKF